MKRFLLSVCLVLFLPLVILADGEGISRNVRNVTWATNPTVVVTGDEDKFSDTINLREGVFNAISITLKLESGGTPDLIPKIELESPLEPGTFTGNHPDPIITSDDATLAATGTFIFDIQIPLVRRFRIHLDGETGGAATTVTALALVQ